MIWWSPWIDLLIQYTYLYKIKQNNEHRFGFLVQRALPFHYNTSVKFDILLSSHGAVNNNVSHTLHWAITFQRVKHVKNVFIVRVGLFVGLILGWTDNLVLSYNDSSTMICRNVVLKVTTLNNKRERTLETWSCWNWWPSKTFEYKRKRIHYRHVNRCLLCIYSETKHGWRIKKRLLRTIQSELVPTNLIIPIFGLY